MFFSEFGQLRSDFLLFGIGTGRRSLDLGYCGVALGVEQMPDVSSFLCRTEFGPSYQIQELLYRPCDRVEEGFKHVALSFAHKKLGGPCVRTR